jgi:hypothetical protein
MVWGRDRDQVADAVIEAERIMMARWRCCACMYEKSGPTRVREMERMLRMASIGAAPAPTTLVESPRVKTLMIVS